MAGIGESRFLNLLEDLTGKVALVTGGGAGIGYHNTKYLALKGATVYIASRNQAKCEKAIEQMHAELGPRIKRSQILFHHLQLNEMASAQQSAEAFSQKHPRLDILVLNAGISLAPMDKLNADGYDQTFGTNHLAHYAFTMGILPLVRRTAQQYGEARIVVVSSVGYTFLRENLDYGKLTTPVPSAKATGFRSFAPGFMRYCETKLANVLFAVELDRRLKAQGVSNVYVNACHPGSSLGTGLAAGTLMPDWIDNLIRIVGRKLSNTNVDSAKTQSWLAASAAVREERIGGMMYFPRWSWFYYWLGCGPEKLTVLGGDVGEQGKLWRASEECYRKATGKNPPI